MAFLELFKQNYEKYNVFRKNKAINIHEEFKKLYKNISLEEFYKTKTLYGEEKKFYYNLEWHFKKKNMENYDKF
jgi:hypothetical protein